MNRKQPVIDGEYYHVYNRGNDQREIFRTPGDYAFFLSRLRTYLPRYGVRAVAYTLLPNHYHMILTQEPGGDLPSMMGTLATSYVHRFKLLYSRTGHLFEGPYKYRRLFDETWVEVSFSRDLSQMKETSANRGNSRPAPCVIMVWLAGCAGDIVSWERVLIGGYASPIIDVGKSSCRACLLLQAGVAVPKPA